MLSTFPLWIKETVKELRIQPSSYKTELEKYIIDHNPQSVYDVEFLTKEFDKKQSKGFWA